MFEQAADLSPSEIKAYRNFAFTDTLSNPGNDPFFSVDNAAFWISSLGYQLYLLHDDSVISSTSWGPEDASTKQLIAYRTYILADQYVGHPFFSLENPDIWINPIAFQAYMDSTQDQVLSSTPATSRAPSRATSSISMAESRASSRVSFIPSSRASSPISYASSDMLSRPSSSMSVEVIEIHDSDSDDPGSTAFPAARSTASSGNPFVPPLPKVEIVDASISLSSLPPATVPDTKPERKKKGKGKGKLQQPQQTAITRQEKVDHIVHSTSVPMTYDVPRTPTALLVDLSGSVELLRAPEGHLVPLDTFIRAQNHESWDGGAGHTVGDVNVAGFTSNLSEKIRCRRCHLKCNGIDTCEFFEEEIFDGLERYEADEKGMQELWDHALDQNEEEAASAPGIICRFYVRIMKSKCKLWSLRMRLQTPSAHGKRFFIGCSHWKRSEQGKHLYWPMPLNIDEAVLQFVLDNDGHLPNGPQSLNETCFLTAHPRIGLNNCSYSHIIDGQIRVPEIRHRKCKSEMIIFIPVKPSPATLHKAIVILRNPHNHPMHPKTKPSAEDNVKLGTAVKSAGLTGLTVQKLRNAPSTLSIYDGKPVAESSPAYANSRRVRDFITTQKKVEYPMGMGWEGILHELNVRQVMLPKSERYIHTAMSKNGFRLVVTMHPQIAMFIHKLLCLYIDYTFRRVEGKMDEWEVAGFLERFQQRLTFGSLYCDTQTKEAFAQLFTELFDTIFQVTGESLKLAPFYPDAKCRVIVMDGEVPQAQGYAQFLATYNDPSISGISTRNPNELLPKSLKICNPHFERHIDDLPKHIPIPVIARLKSIMGLETQIEIDAWHKFVAAQEDIEIQRWSTLTFYNADQWRDKLFIRYTAIPEGTGILWGIPVPSGIAVYGKRLTLTFHSAAQWRDQLFIHYGKWTARLFASPWPVFRL
ncbi:hypothetical protein B0H14DRAFT_2631897 [Mycena olivaceomarginata]|nr:hypothetical protein B0H14DRAFT_2631897 [Mycena olivaceomarginata]